jgi:hypothetical protein
MWDREWVLGEPLREHRGQLPGARLYARVVRSGTSEIRGASGHGDPQHKLDLTTLRGSGPHKEEIVVPLTQTQLASAVADRAEITRTGEHVPEIDVIAIRSGAA